MPVGFYEAEKIKKPDRAEKPEKRAAVKQDKMRRFASQTQHAPMMEKQNSILSILMIGPSQAFQRDWICGMNQNMGEAASKCGLSFYTNDFQTITEMVSAKKRLESLLWNPKGQGLPSENIMASEELAHQYFFAISPAGDQKINLGLDLYTVSPECMESGEKQYDAVWVMAAEAGVGAAYTAWAQERIRNVSPEIPLYMISCGFEKAARFSGTGDHWKLTAKEAEERYENCKADYGGWCLEHNRQGNMILSQVYGALEYSGMDKEKGMILKPVFSSVYGQYLPVNCQMPLLQTLRAAARTSSFFESMEGSSVLKGIEDVMAEYENMPGCEMRKWIAEGGEHGTKEKI